MQLPPHPILTSARAVRALADPTSPLLVQMVVTRRCNLTCGYCNEYDDFSPPIPLETLKKQIDHIADLGTLVLTMTGGEPFIHPQLDEICAHAVSRGMIVTTISNAYPITERWIGRMNRAGLSLIQISVDNIEPNEWSQKSWSKIKKKLELLKEHAKFKVNVNAVLGSCMPDETRRVVREAADLGFYMTVGLMHNELGQIEPGLAGDQLSSLFVEMRGQSNKSFFHQFGEGWEDAMLRDGASPWKCRAGARYLYVDEKGMVSYCSQRRGEPGVSILQYTKGHAHSAFYAKKGCENACTIACVRRASAFDEWRAQPGELLSSVAATPVERPRDRTSLPLLR